MTLQEPFRKEVLRLVGSFFQGRPDKAKLWMSTKNPLFGNISPDSMLAMGRGQKLLQIVKYQLDEIHRLHEAIEEAE